MRLTPWTTSTNSNTSTPAARQSKLFLFGLFRTVSALAGSASSSSSDIRILGGSAPAVNPNHQQYSAFRNAPVRREQQQQQQHVQQQQQQQHSEQQQFQSPPPLTLRLARRSDVLSIQKCNLATLPENYNQHFYENHIREWPELVFVAVDKSPAPPTSTNSPSSSYPFGSRGSSGAVGGGETERERVVAYVLGKVEERTVYTPIEEALEDMMYGDENHNHPNLNQNPLLTRHRGGRDSFDHRQYTSKQRNNHNNPYPAHVHSIQSTERVGHVTSLAVLENYRRRGLAIELMKQLHYHLVSCYKVEYVGLHVRQSNTAAERLYSNFGYQVDSIIPAYYHDGEDAYFMKKCLLQDQTQIEREQRQQHLRQRQQQGSSSSSPSWLSKKSTNSPFSGPNGGAGAGGGLFGSLRRNRPWEMGPNSLRLPRLVGVPAEAPPSSSNNNNHSSQEQRDGEEQEQHQTPELLTGTM